MELLKLTCLSVLLIIYLNILVTEAIINHNPGYGYTRINGANYKTLQTGTFYLNRNRPLWILQDQKPYEQLQRKQTTYTKPLRENVKYDHIKPIYMRNRQAARVPATVNGNYKNFKTKAQKRITFYNGPHLKLPANYIPLEQNHNQRTAYFSPLTTTQLPRFDSLPGEESFEKSTPIFVYTGQKGRMLFNSMMSSYKYPMQEPIPGQTLYPPQTMMMDKNSQQATTATTFSTQQQQPINVTMIPFYAYEAVDPRTLNNHMYATQASSLPLSSKAQRLKKSKKYAAFYASQDILGGQPFDSTTSLPLTLEKPFANHKHQEEEEEVESTTSLPHKKLEVTYNDGADNFRITYEDEDSDANLERPTEVTTEGTPQQGPWPYGNYEISKKYYTLPLYNLGKGEEREQEGRATESPKQSPEKQNKKGSEQPSRSPAGTNKNLENTWFILNSRYKGPLKFSSKNLHSSKYIQTTRSIQDDRDFLKTATPTSTSKTKPKLKPQMRALYGDEKIQIVL